MIIILTVLNVPLNPYQRTCLYESVEYNRIFNIIILYAVASVCGSGRRKFPSFRRHQVLGGRAGWPVVYHSNGRHGILCGQ